MLQFSDRSTRNINRNVFSYTLTSHFPPASNRFFNEDRNELLELDREFECFCYIYIHIYYCY
jgi:hypothetical protein